MNRLFKPVMEQRQYLYENIVLQIKALILEGNLKPGDKLPAEREMVDLFGVSRSCIREAIKSLATMGLVKVIHGQGAFVCETNTGDSAAQIISHLIVPGTGTIHDLFEMRKLLEPQAAQWAAQRRTEEEAAAIMANVTRAQTMAAAHPVNIINLWESDNKFHNLVAYATHNFVLVRTMHGILDLMAESRKSTLRVRNRPPKSAAEHAAVAQAIVAGDPASAREAMLIHLDNVHADLAYL